MHILSIARVKAQCSGKQLQSLESASPLKAAANSHQPAKEEDCSAKDAVAAKHLISSQPSTLCETKVARENAAAEGQATAADWPQTNDRIKVYWPEEKEWFKGTLTAVNPGGKCHVCYDDDDTEWLSLAEQKWERLPEGGLHPPL